ncbi:MAG: MarR family transcriptional regulator [Lachnospiraceae bacterium]|nr:MarR family transcriptional regulator [Lachnospiraceae bacterium]
MDRMRLFEKYISEKHETTIAHEHYLDTMREYSPGTDLYMREMHFMMELEPDCDLSVSEVSEKMNVTVGATSQMATKLEKKGLITRTPDPSDKRRTMISLTEDGKKMYYEHKEYDKKKIQIIGRFFNDYSNEELEKVIESERLFRQALIAKE